MSAITADLGEWAATAPRDRGAVAAERARHAIADTVAVMVAGAGDEGAAVVRRVAGSYGSGNATIIGNAMRKAAPPFAALANGMSAHALDYDDNFLPGLTHASAVLVPALLALAEAHDLPGERLADAYVLGLDLHAVLGSGIGRAHYDAGWHNTATVGTIGTAGACARLLGLDAAGCTRAMSLGVSMASGAKVQFGSPGKPYHAGMAAKNAILAATLAAEGMEARSDAIEGFRGFVSLYGDGSQPDWETQLARVREMSAIERDGLSPKIHPCCGSAHRVLDVVVALRERHGFTDAQVQSVRAEVGYGNQRNLCYDTPQNEMEARFSLPYCVAVAIRQGVLRLSDFTRDAVHRPALSALLPRVQMTATPQGAEDAAPGGRLPHRVAITLDDDTVLEGESLWARGTAALPLGDAERDAKFRDCCEGFLSPSDLAATAGLLARVEAVDSVRALMAHLDFEAGADSGERFSARRLSAAE